MAFIKSVLSACRCHFFKVMGSLIPLPSFEARETDQIKLQANGVCSDFEISSSDSHLCELELVEHSHYYSNFFIDRKSVV